MKPNEPTYDWGAARGDKWAGLVSGLEPTFEPMNGPIFTALRLDAPYRIAEVGCGGGGMAIELARRAPAGSVVHGFDISPSLVTLARHRLSPGERTVAFSEADMSSAAPEQPYDRLVSRLGVMFFQDPQAAFANLVRWLRPGGRFAFATWGPSSESPWRTIAHDVVAEIIEMRDVDPDAPGPFRYEDARKLVALLGRAGFKDVGVQDWRGALPIGGGLPAAEAASFALTAFSSFGEMLAKAGDDALKEARQRLTARYVPIERDGTVSLDGSIHIFTGSA